MDGCAFEAPDHCYTEDHDACCEVVGPLTWRRPPASRRCCGGVPGDAAALTAFLLRIASLLDRQQPRAFALLQSAWLNGTRDEVDELQAEVEEAVSRFNSAAGRGDLRATALTNNADAAGEVPFEIFGEAVADEVAVVRPGAPIGVGRRRPALVRRGLPLPEEEPVAP